MTTSLPSETEPEAQFTGAPFDASTPGAPGERRYVYHDPRIAYAVNIALVTRRPLLITGSPGSGKSTLAADVAERLGWALISTTVTSRTRLDDLVARVDTVQRLSDATGGGRGVDRSPGAYVVPGVLWWAFHPESAARVPRAQDRRVNPAGSALGTVVLLDEIDKAEPDLPNDLLGPLDRYAVVVPTRAEPVAAERGCLVIITSNRERTMPPAFLRRCVSLELDDNRLEFFVAVATSHFQERTDTLYADVAARTLALVDATPGSGRAPSMAEYLDTVQACITLGQRPGSGLWERIEEAALRKTRTKAPVVNPS